MIPKIGKYYLWLCANEGPWIASVVKTEKNGTIYANWRSLGGKMTCRNHTGSISDWGDKHPPKYYISEITKQQFNCLWELYNEI